MGLAEQYAADLGRMIADRPTEFGYMGGTYTGLRSKLSRDFTLGDYGYTTGYRFSLRVLAASLPQVPEKGETISIGEVKYRILDPVELDSFDVSVLLHLAGESA